MRTISPAFERSSPTSSIFNIIASPVSAQGDGSSGKTDGDGYCEQSFSTTLDLMGQFFCRGAGSVVAPDIGATANFARFRLLGDRKLLS